MPTGDPIRRALDRLIAKVRVLARAGLGPVVPTSPASVKKPVLPVPVGLLSGGKKGVRAVRDRIGKVRTPGGVRRGIARLRGVGRIADRAPRARRVPIVRRVIFGVHALPLEENGGRMIEDRGLIPGGPVRLSVEVNVPNSEDRVPTTAVRVRTFVVRVLPQERSRVRIPVGPVRRSVGGNVPSSEDRVATTVVRGRTFEVLVLLSVESNAQMTVDPARNFAALVWMTGNRVPRLILRGVPAGLA